MTYIVFILWGGGQVASLVLFVITFHDCGSVKKKEDRKDVVRPECISDLSSLTSARFLFLQQSYRLIVWASVAPVSE